ncbi:hypothetical protein C8Q78DRAFT_568769 [Trametes maxima]|nr:hypothetical protein C8Q78DRAFT_568769 [Trametes maxima]
MSPIMNTYRSFATPVYTSSSVLQPSALNNAPEPTPTSLSPSCRVHDAADAENVPPFSSPRSPDKGDARELRLCILDMGLEDPDEEDERELFESIPGFDEFLDAADDDEEPCAAFVEAAELGETSDSISETCEEDSDDGSDAEEESDTPDGESGVPPPPSWAIIAPSSPVDRYSPSSVSEDSQSVDDHDVISDQQLSSRDECSELRARTESGSEAESELDGARHSNDHGIGQHNIGSVLLADSTHPGRAVRRSTRLVGSKRYREDNPPEDSEPTHRPSKRRRTAGPKSEHKPSTRTRTSYSGTRKKQRRREPGPARAAPPNRKQGGSRAQRLSEDVIRACVVTDTAEAVCGHPDCTTKLSVHDLGAARAHHKSHYADALKSGSGVAAVWCLWEGCTTEREIPANASALQRHFDNVHLRVQYMCPRRCEKNGNLRTFSRSDEIRRHVKDSPCQGLIDNPLT